jgi:antirestriction protein
LPTWIVIDWEATWNRNLRHDYSTSEHDGKIWLFHH